MIPVEITVPVGAVGWAAVIRVGIAGERVAGGARDFGGCVSGTVFR